MANWFTRLMARRPARRAYEAANVSRFTADWIYGPTSGNEELKNGLRPIRERARQLERDNAHARRFLALAEQNIIGRGVKFASKVYDSPAPNAKPDGLANDLIEQHWNTWGRDWCSVVRGQDWVDLQRLVVRCWKRDGEVFLRKVMDPSSPYLYRLQVLESDCIDEQYNVGGLGVNPRIIMGVEVDQYGSPTAYYAFRNHPGDHGGTVPTERIRVPADEMIHIFRPERPGDVRGISALASVMVTLKMLAGYEEAHLIAARSAACQMTYYKVPPGEDWQGDTKDEQGPVQEMEPGSIVKLPYGWDVGTANTAFPSTNYADCVKAYLRKIAGGFNVSYSSLASDLSDANYSSMRSGTVSENDQWKCDQDFIIAKLHHAVFADWLRAALTTGALVVPGGKPLPLAKYDKFLADTWQPRRWLWVDPLKDLQAAQIARQQGWKSDSEIIAEQGGDPDEVWGQMEKDAQKKELYGITPAPAPEPANGVANESQQPA